MLAGARSGGKVRAYQQLVAGRRLAQTPDDGPLLNVLPEMVNLIKIVGSAVDTCAAWRLAPTASASPPAADDNTVRLWDADTGQPIGQPLTGHTDAVCSVAFSPDGKRIVSGVGDKTVRLWDADTGQPIGQPLTGHTDSVNSVAFSPDGKRIASGSDDNTVRLWDAATGQPIGAAAHRPHRRGEQRGVQPRRQRASPPAAPTTTVRVWDAATGQPDRRSRSTGHTDAVISVAFSPDGKRIASGSDDETVRLWDAATGQPIGQPLTGHTRHR